jgi:cytochrome c biogenesis protein CcdA
MVGTIIPIVNGKRKMNRPPLELAAHSLGGLLGGLCCGVALGGFPGLVLRYPNSGSRVAASLCGLVATAYALKEVGIVNVFAPQRTWQVRRGWLSVRPPVVPSGLYGLCLGFGLLTRINSCLYPVLVWIVLNHSVAEGALVMGAFGVCRTVPLWIIYMAARDSDEWYQCAVEAGRFYPATRLANASILIMLGGLSAATLRW